MVHDIGRRIAECRRMRGLNQEELAELALLNRVTIFANRNVVRVERIGASELKNESWIIQDSSSRKVIEFPIPRVATAQ